MTDTPPTLPLSMVRRDRIRVRLWVRREEGEKALTPAAFVWNDKAWISQASGLPLMGGLSVVGWERDDG